MRSAAQPAESLQESSTGRTEMRPALSDLQGLERRLCTLEGASPERPASPVPGAAPAGAATTCLFAPREFAGGRNVRALTAGSLWIPGLQSLGPNFPSHARENPHADPRLCSSSKLQRGGLREGARGAGRLGRTAPCPGQAVPQRCGSNPLGPGCSTSVPVVRTRCSGGKGMQDQRSGPTTAKESSDSVLIEHCRNCESEAECGGNDRCPPRAHLGGHNGGHTGPAYCVPWRLTTASVCNLHNRPPRRALLFFPLYR